jgi:hypothetical protein
MQCVLLEEARYLIYFFIGSKLRKEVYLYNQQQSAVDYYLKSTQSSRTIDTIFRLYDCSYFHLLIALQAIQPQEDQFNSLMTFFKWSTLSRPLVICVISNIYLFIMSVVPLLRHPLGLPNQHQG